MSPIAERESAAPETVSEGMYELASRASELRSLEHQSEQQRQFIEGSIVRWSRWLNPYQIADATGWNVEQVDHIARTAEKRPRKTPEIIPIPEPRS